MSSNRSASGERHMLPVQTVITASAIPPILVGGDPGGPAAHFPCHCGARFSRNAVIPSCASQVTALVAMVSAISR